jgi:hypothetical protein
MSADDFRLLRATLQTSFLGRIVRAIDHVWTEIANRRLATAIRRAAQDIRSSPRPERIRLWAIGISVAAVVHLALRQVQPSHMASVVPDVVVLLVAVFAGVFALGANAFAAAWEGSLLRRLWNRLSETRPP